MATPGAPEYLHVAYLPQSGGWVFPVIQEVQNSRSERFRALAHSWAGSDLSELGLAVTTKLAILPHVIGSVDKQLGKLGEEAAGLGNLQEHIDRGAGFMPRDRNLPYKLLASLDAELLVLRRNVKDLTDTEHVIPFERLRAIYTGLDASLARLQEWLILKVRERDAELAGGAPA